LEPQGVCIPTGNCEVLLAAVYKHPDHAWNDTNITELLRFKHKSLLAEDLNEKYPFWNSIVSNHSGAKLINLLHINEIVILAPPCPSHYIPTGNGDVLGIIVHKKVRLSKVIVADFLESGHLPIIFHLLDHIRNSNLSNLVDKFTDWEWFQSLATDLMSPRIEMNLE
jgi:hypothetical protein